MSRDVVALVRQAPDPAATAAELRLRASSLAGTTFIYDDTGRLLVSVPSPVFVQVPGEVERLLGTTEQAAPIWWVEIRAAADLPAAAELADQVAGHLIERYDGSLWRETAQ